VPPADPRGLADGVRALAADPARAQALADAGARNVELNFKLDDTLSRSAAALGEALRQSNGPSRSVV
jgi:hypothetical protein